MQSLTFLWQISIDYLMISNELANEIIDVDANMIGRAPVPLPSLDTISTSLSHSFYITIPFKHVFSSYWLDTISIIDVSSMMHQHC